MLFTYFTLALGFASINAEEVPRGIMPKRQIVGTGSTTSSTVISTSSESSTTISTSQSSQTTQSTSSATSTVISDTSTAPTSSSSVITSDTSSAGPSSTSSAISTSESSVVSSQSTIPSSASSIISSQAPSSTEVSTTIAVTTTNSAGSTVTSSIATHTLAPASSISSGSAVRTLTGSDSSLVVVGSSTINRATLTGATTITSALEALATVPSTYTSYWTEDGTVHSKVVTTDAVITSTTGFATATIKPSLQNGGGSGSNLSTSSKKIVGGVVGGIGGAILIGGIALVAWRLWGKKKRQQVPQDDFLDSRDDSIRREKSTRGSEGLPDRYQQPPVNTASNF